MRRFAVAIHFQGSLCPAPHQHSAQDAVDALLKQFPDDLFGHAYAGFVALNGVSGSDFELNRWKVVRQNGLTTYEPKVQERLEQAKKHYDFVVKKILKSLYKNGRPNAEINGQPTFSRQEDKALEFSNWRGIEGADELLRFFQRQLGFIEVVEQILASGSLFSVQEITDSATIYNRIKQDPRLLDVLTRQIDSRSPSHPLRPRFDNSPDDDNAEKLAFALNILMTGPPLEILPEVLNLKMSSETLEVLQGRPHPTSMEKYRVWALRLNRRILEDVFSPQVIRTTDMR